MRFQMVHESSLLATRLRLSYAYNSGLKIGVLLSSSVRLCQKAVKCCA